MTKLGRVAGWAIVITASIVWAWAAAVLITARAQSQEVQEIEARCLASWAQDLAAHPNLPWRELNAFETHVVYRNAGKFMSPENQARVRNVVVFKHSEEQWHIVLRSGDCVIAVFLVTNEWMSANLGRDT